MYEFSFGALFIGLLIIIFGGGIALFYKQIADNLASGVSSYENVKRFGIITTVIGFAIALSLHSIVLNFLLSVFFR